MHNLCAIFAKFIEMCKDFAEYLGIGIFIYSNTNFNIRKLT